MRRVILAVVSTVTGLVLLLSFKTHSTTTSTAAPPAAIGTTSTGTRTVTGDAADTQFGPVQVRISVANGKVTNATAVEYPTGTPRDAQINAYAIPVLNQEAAQAGSADIDMVSGATYTSQGYLQSLQSALDKAGA
ncbi:MAG TPA: FMN-binding protein [Pseudonocardiaceae bacterium]|jgi:uncharacterized protein with FMN-binding domain|nr:FMN-binding protein [Pseudonocardiaceae bacterium]